MYKIFLHKLFFTPFIILASFCFIFLPRFVNAVGTTPVIDTATSGIGQDFFVDGPITLEITGTNFGASKGQVLNLDTNAILNIAYGGDASGGWTNTWIRVYYPFIPSPDAFRIGENRIVVKSSEGIESLPITIVAKKRGAATITSVSPSTIHIDEDILINGSGFGVSGVVTNPIGILKNYAEQVFADGAQKIISWSDTQVKVRFSNLKEGYDNIIVLARQLVTGSPTFSNAFPVSIVNAPLCSSDTWSCGSWNTCGVDGKQSRSCSISFDCQGIATPSPNTTQSCTTPKQQLPITPTQPTCYEDAWSCGDWGTCSPNGIQTRSCKRTYDCSSAETQPPATSQYCQAPNQSQTPFFSNNTSSGGGSSAQLNNTINESSNQDSIIQATVKLICLINKTSGMQGSGTVIDPKGIILTNRHVVEGTKGCVIGFINNSDDDPSFIEVADVVKLSTDEDIALIKIRNDGRKSFVYSDISTGSVNSKNLGNRIMIFGYPSIGGAKLNYSDGAVSGFGSAKDGMGNYIKTNTAIDHGNSGGGAYLANNSRFIGIPSAGIKGDLSSMGYILSINKIKSWINGSGLAYNGNGFNNLSSKSIKASSLLENIDIDNIDILDVSSANVSIYSSKTKTTLLPNNPGTIQIYNRPTFQINNIDEESDVVGYYVYFGTNMKADPVKKGKLIKKPEFIPSAITQKGVYYFIFRAKNKNGGVSESIITEYRYKK